MINILSLLTNFIINVCLIPVFLFFHDYIFRDNVNFWFIPYIQSVYAAGIFAGYNCYLACQKAVFVYYTWDEALQRLGIL